MVKVVPLFPSGFTRVLFGSDSRSWESNDPENPKSQYKAINILMTYQYIDSFSSLKPVQKNHKS